MNNYKKKLIAHRGESYIAPENTLAAFELAWSNGACAIEFDLRLTRDNKFVISHDSNLERVANDTREIRNCDLAEIENIDVGVSKGEKWAGEKLATFEQVLNQANQKMPEDGQLVIEVKDGKEAVAPLIKMLDKTDESPSKWVIVSFNSDVIENLRQSRPDLNSQWITSPKQNLADKKWQPNLEQIFATTKQIDSQGMRIKDSELITAQLIKQIHDEGLTLDVWVVDDPKRAKELIDLGADTVTTNRPKWISDKIAQGCV